MSGREEMKTERPNLKPCPFCGSDVDFVSEMESRCFVAVCLECYADGPMGSTKSHAVELWNERQAGRLPGSLQPQEING